MIQSYSSKRSLLITKTQFVSFSLLATITTVGLLALFLLETSQQAIPAAISCAIQLIAGWIVLKNCRSVSDYFSPIVMFYVTFEIFIAMGSVVMYLNPNLLSHSISAEPYLSQDLSFYMFVMSMAILVTALGSEFHRKIAHIRPPMIDSPSLRAGLVSGLSRYWKIIVLGYVSCVLVSLLRIYLQPDIGSMLLMFLRAEIVGGLLRQQMTQAQFQGGLYFGQGYFNFIIYNILPFFTLLVFMGLSFRGKTVAKWVFVLLTLVLLFAEFQRAPAVYMIVALIIANFLLNANASYMKLLSSLLLIILGLALATILLGRNTGLNLGADLLYRIFISQSQTGSYVFQIFPRLSEHAWGGIYLSNLSGILPGPDLSYAADLFERVNGRLGGASHSSIAEAFSNFSTFGTLIFAFSLGVYFSSVRDKFQRALANKDPLFFGYYVIFLAFIVPAISNGGITGALLHIFGLNLCLLLIRLLANTYSRRAYQF